jgi:G3E family GTPase
MAIPVTIVGGYLGAGKTTLINHILTAKHGLRIAVLVNDFGAVNIDASLIAEAADDTISLTNGCVCCSIHDDLGAALDLQTRRVSSPDHIVIETSGVAEPARILTYATAWPGIRLDAVVTLVDAETIRARVSDKFVGRVVRRQLTAADFLVVNKLDLVTAGERAAIGQWLADQAPAARRIEAVQANVDPALLFEAAQTCVPRTVTKNGVPKNGVPKNGAGESDIAGFFSVKIDVPWPVCIAALGEILRASRATIHRVKGFVTDEATGQRLLVQRVGNRQSIAPMSGRAALDTATALIAIGTVETDLRVLSQSLAAMRSAA